MLAFPLFDADRPADATDFIDLHQTRGIGSVRDSISTATAVSAVDAGLGNARALASGFTDWPEPEPLTEPLEALPYPVEALPRLLRDAVTEAQAFVQAPIALVACSARSALSLAAQGVANVRRDHQLVGPISLYLLAVADSGERKTTCDAIFSAGLRDWETERRQEMAAEIVTCEAASAVHEAKKAGVLEAIKQKRRRGQDTAGEERDPVRCLAAQRGARQRYRPGAGEADLPVRAELCSG